MECPALSGRRLVRLYVKPDVDLGQATLATHHVAEAIQYRRSLREQLSPTRRRRLICTQFASFANSGLLAIMEDKGMSARPGAPHSGSDLAAFIVTRFLLHHLLRMGRLMDGDFESVMILGALDLQRAAHSLTERSMLPSTGPLADDPLPDSMLRKQGLRSSDLAQITGVPRETVRRKLERLQTSGKVRRHEDGRWHACDSAMPATRVFARDAIESLRSTADQLSSASPT